MFVVARHFFLFFPILVTLLFFKFDFNLQMEAESPDGDLSNLYPALIECFGIILLGYVAGKFNLVSDTESRGLATFVGTFALPALIFSSLCKLDLAAVQWNFLLGVAAAKTVRNL